MSVFGPICDIVDRNCCAAGRPYAAPGKAESKPVLLVPFVIVGQVLNVPYEILDELPLGRKAPVLTSRNPLSPLLHAGSANDAVDGSSSGTVSTMNVGAVTA
jgi:hypothetical protein